MINLNQHSLTLAPYLLGKIIRFKSSAGWLAARIIETEAYCLTDKASHASLGFTEKRKALFMPAGTIYMYSARGSDSLNVSARGAGNAVLIKSAFPYQDEITTAEMITIMQQNNPLPSGALRPIQRLCNGQTLLCKALGIKVKQWNQQQFERDQFYLDDIAYQPQEIVQTKRLGIPKGRDEHLPYRFIDAEYMRYCTKPVNPSPIAYARAGYRTGVTV